MKKILLVLIVVIIAAVIFIKPYYTFVSHTMGISLLKLMFPGQTARSTNDQVNILILGIGGGNHDGPNLSDSIIVVNYNFDKNKLTTIGLPRDIWSPPLRDRINSAYAYGVAKGNTQTGIKLAKATIETVINQPIHYAVVIDFDKFKKLIDYVGGVDITVKTSFTDSEYPIEGKENDTCGGDPDYKCRYTQVTFDKGMQHMDGERALVFVRSRHGDNGEGSDFARSQRQQLVLTDLKDKMMKILLSHDINKISSLYEAVNNSLIRDISNQEIAVIAKNVLLKKNFTQKNVFLPQELFAVPDANDYDGRYVLIPKDNDQNLLKNYFNCAISEQEKCSVV